MGVKETVEGKKEESLTEDTSSEGTDSEESSSTEDKKDEETEDELSDEEKEEQKEALSLYRNLRGPKGAEYLSQIAKTQGLTLEGTKKEQKAQAKSIADTFKTHLGSDFAFFSEKIGAAFEEIIKDRLLPEVKGAKDTAIEIKVDGILKDIYEKESIPENEQELIRTAIEKLAEDLPYNGTGNLKVYLKRLYNITVTEDSKTRKRLEKVRRNAEDNDGISADVPAQFRVVKGPSNPTLHDAVSAAARGEKWE